MILVLYKSYREGGGVQKAFFMTNPIFHYYAKLRDKYSSKNRYIL